MAFGATFGPRSYRCDRWYRVRSVDGGRCDATTAGVRGCVAIVSVSAHARISTSAPGSAIRSTSGPDTPSTFASGFVRGCEPGDDL